MLQNLSLNCKEYDEYLVDTYGDSTNGYSGIHYIFRFPNGYGASIVKIFGSEGYEQDLWELAVILFEEETDNLGPGEYIIVYPEQIVQKGMTIGSINDKEVCEILKKIKNL